MAKLERSHDVELNELALAAEVALDELGRIAKSRIVYQQLDLDSKSLDLGDERRWAVGCREVCGYRANDGPFASRLAGEGHEGVSVAAMEHERPSFGRKLPCHFAAEPARCSRDERPLGCFAHDESLPMNSWPSLHSHYGGQIVASTSAV